MTSSRFSPWFSTIPRCAFNKPIRLHLYSNFHSRAPLRHSTAMDTTPDQTPAPAPAPASKLVEYRGTQYNVIKEGQAYILNPPSQEAASKATRRDLQTEDESQSVFYNPIQQFNRDLSVLAIRAFSEHTVDLKKQKQDQKAKAKPKKRNPSTSSGGQGQKRKREEEAEEQAKSNKRDQPAKQDADTQNSTEQHVSEVPAPANAPANAPATANANTANGKEDPAASQFTILDALSATGLRALRYASEIPIATKIVGNDLSASAIQSMKTNIDYNELTERIQPNLGDARAYMYSLNGVNKFDVIDLDPYGTASPFMDAAVQGVKDGGLLCVTCTDAGVWASTGYAEKAFSLYGGIPIKGAHSHEGGLRLILNGLAMSAAKYGLAIEPLLSLSIDFYARTFVRVTRSPAQVKFTASNTLLHYNCDSGCGAWTNQYIASTKTKLDKKGNPISHHSLAQAPTTGPHCEHCGFKTHLAGPMWGGRLHNPHFIQKILEILPTLDREVYQTVPRIEGMLTTALEEDLDLSGTLASTLPTTTTTTTNKNGTEAEAEAQAEAETNPYPHIIPKLPPTRDPHPFYLNLGNLSRALHCTTPPIDSFRSAIASTGHSSTRSHAKPNSIRTDAPWSVIWEIMREWIRQHAPVKEGAVKIGTPGAALMAKDRSKLYLGEKQQGQEQGKAGEDPYLARLKADLLDDLSQGRDVSDLVMRVEASLYRSGPRYRKKAEGGASGSGSGGVQHPSTLKVDFEAEFDREPVRRLVRYQVNPRANWGPLNRAS